LLQIEGWKEARESATWQNGWKEGLVGCVCVCVQGQISLGIKMNKWNRHLSMGSFRSGWQRIVVV
jgi:hypothetical protein